MFCCLSYTKKINSNITLFVRLFKQEKKGSSKNQMAFVDSVPTLYHVLCTTPSTFNKSKISKTRKQLLLKLHPDKVTASGIDHASEKLQLVVLAFEILNDDANRRRYDLLLEMDYQKNVLKNHLNNLEDFRRKILNVDISTRPSTKVESDPKFDLNNVYSAIKPSVWKQLQQRKKHKELFAHAYFVHQMIKVDNR